MPTIDYSAAFLIPYPLGVWRAESTVGEAGPTTGVPEAQERDDGSLPLVTVTPSGAQSADTTMELRWVTPGYPPTSGYVVKEAADTLWQGRDTALLGVVNGPLRADTGTTAHVQPHGITLPNGYRLVAHLSDPLVGDNAVEVAVRAPDATSWTYVTVVSGLSSLYPCYPCLVYLDGAVLLFHWNVDATNQLAQVDIYQSLDFGATWTRYLRSVLPSTITAPAIAGAGTAGYLLRRLRAGVLRGQILLVAHLLAADTTLGSDRDLLQQYASSDRAGSFVLVDSLTGKGFPDIAEWDGRLFVAYANATTQFDECILLGNAWTQLSSLTADPNFLHDYSTMLTVTTDAITGADLALAVLEGGIYYLARTDDNEKSCQIVRWLGPVADRNIANMGVGPASSGYGAWWLQEAGATATDYPTDFTAWGWRGLIQVAYVPESSSGSFDTQLFTMSMGGNTTVVQPFNRQFHADIYQACWDRIWAATSLPTVARYGWTGSGLGTESITTTPGWVRLVSAGNTRYYTQTVTSAPTEARFGTFMRQVLGGSTSTRAIVMGLRWADTGVGYEVELRFSGTAVILRDVNGAVDLATTTIDVSAGVYCLLAINENGECVAAVAPFGEQFNREYVRLANGTALTDDAGAGGTDVVFTFGNRAAATAISEWGWAGLAYDPLYAAANTLAAGQSNPEDLTPIPNGLSRPTYIGSNVSINVRGGPAWVNDQINIPSDATYPYRALLPRGWDGDAGQDIGGLYPSPAAGWRSLVVGTPADYRVAFRHPSRSPERPVRGFLALHVERPNMATIDFQGYASGAWSTLGTLTTSQGGLSFTRTGARVRPAASASLFLRTNEVRDGYVILTPTLGAAKVRPILRNTGGPWGLATIGPMPVLEIDPASLDGTEPISGTATIIFPRATLIVPIAGGGSTNYTGYALRWADPPSTTNTYEGDYRVGKAVVGELWSLRQPDWGVARRVEAQTDIDTMDSGRRTARVRGARRRVWELPYTSIRAEQFALDTATYATWYQLETGGAIVGMTGEECEIIEGLMDELEGGAIPAGYLPVVQKDGGTQSLRGYKSALYGRLTTQDTTWQLETGNETLGSYAGVRLAWEQEL